MELALFYDWTFFDILREVVFWTSPVVFMLGVALMMYGNYQNFEKLMAKEFGLRQKILPKLETNIYSFHQWCLKKNTFIGLVCVIYSIIVFVALKDHHSLTEVMDDTYFVR
jgi:hypothetical protein